MKTKIKIVALFLLLSAVTVIAPQKTQAQGFSISFQVFYDELSPYGNWVYTPNYGYAWLPNAAPGFFPYATDGYWVFTEDGWTWVSYYSWGWAPFHYGRWYIDPYYGAMWVPGYEWGPGWVAWRRSGDYYGWAPIGPGVSYDYAYGRDYFVPNDCWRFVRDRDFGRPYIYNYYVDNSVNVTIINNSTVIYNEREDRPHNTRYNAGPDRHDVESRGGRTITPVTIKESNRPGQEMGKNELVLYRPRVEKTEALAHNPAPSKVVALQNVQSSSSKNAQLTKQNGSQPVHDRQVQPQQSTTYSKTEAVKPYQQNGNPSGKTEAVKPYEQRGNPSGKTEAVKPAQQQHGNSSGKTEAVKPYQQNGNTSGKNQEVKSQPQRGNTSGKTEAVKPAQKNGNPSGKTEAVKPPQKNTGKTEAVKQQSNQVKSSNGGKQEQGNSSKTGKMR